MTAVPSKASIQPIAPLRPQGDGNLVLISVNPKAGARSRRPLVEKLARLLRARRLHAEVMTDLDQLKERAAQAQKSGVLRAVVAAGGDGTVATVANLTEPGVPIMPLPLGTENVLSKHLKMSADPGAAVRTLMDGEIATLDAGCANGRLFLLMAGCGFDAEVVRRVHSARVGHINHLTYIKPILDSIRNYHYPELRVYCGDDPQPRRARWAFVVNVPRYAFGLNMAPEANGTDGLVDVCTFRQGSLWNGLCYLGGVVIQRHHYGQDFATQQTTRVRIEADEPVPYQLDGDPGGFLPLEIEVLPRRLTLVVPPGYLQNADRPMVPPPGKR